MKKLSMALVLVLCIMMFPVSAMAASPAINVVINGKAVQFTDDSGYPYIDENNRTMVPLRITMESAGAAVGYDAANRTAIVITEHDRIEVPIGTNILYNNNIKIENDTVAVVQNGRTYLPIRAVLESADFTVEWDGNTRTVDAYTFKFDENEFVPYSTSSLATLISQVLKGNVVYVNGQYYATPEYVKMITNVQIHYLGDDLNTAIYPQQGRYDIPDESQYEWVSGRPTLDKVLVQESKLAGITAKYTESGIPGYVYVYAFYTEGGATSGPDILYAVDDMTDAFMEAENDSGTFSGIRMKKENGVLYYSYPDLKAKGLV